MVAVVKNGKARILKSDNARQFIKYSISTTNLVPPDYKSIVSSSPLYALEDALQIPRDPAS